MLSYGEWVSLQWLFLILQMAFKYENQVWFCFSLQLMLRNSPRWGCFSFIPIFRSFFATVFGRAHNQTAWTKEIFYLWACAAFPNPSSRLYHMWELLYFFLFGKRHFVPLEKFPFFQCAFRHFPIRQCFFDIPF